MKSQPEGPISKSTPSLFGKVSMSFLFVQMPKRIIRLNASHERCDTRVHPEVLRCYKFKIPSQLMGRRSGWDGDEIANNFAIFNPLKSPSPAKSSLKLDGVCDMKKGVRALRVFLFSTQLDQCSKGRLMYSRNSSLCDL